MFSSSIRVFYLDSTYARNIKRAPVNQHGVHNCVYGNLQGKIKLGILALDLGTKCGWACTNGQSGVWNLKPSTHESAGVRYQKFARILREYMSVHNVSQVVYEEVHAHVAVDAAHVYGGLMAVLQMVCVERGIEYQGIGVGTIKKHGTGNGHAKKDDMIVAATLKFSKVNIIDDNHADALILLDYAQNKLGSR